MRSLLAVMFATGLAACSPAAPPAQSESPEPSSSIAPSETAAEEASAGTFHFTPGVMDCPAGCPSYGVSEALDEPSGVPLLVEGYLFVDADGMAWFCEALEGSAPPRCAGTRLAFDGLDLYGPSLEELPGFEELDGVQWTDMITILGEVTAGR